MQHPMIETSFPMSSGATAWFRYPKYGWTVEDVERFAEFVRAQIVTEPVQAGDSKEGA